MEGSEHTTRMGLYPSNRFTDILWHSNMHAESDLYTKTPIPSEPACQTADHSHPFHSTCYHPSRISLPDNFTAEWFGNFFQEHWWGLHWCSYVTHKLQILLPPPLKWTSLTPRMWCHYLFHSIMIWFRKLQIHNQPKQPFSTNNLRGTLQIIFSPLGTPVKTNSLVVNGKNVLHVGGRWEECPLHWRSVGRMSFTLVFGKNDPYIGLWEKLSLCWQ